jgi:catechol 2,3-dioxygenase-like lactoylglutathione lyase family enzyme
VLVSVGDFDRTAAFFTEIGGFRVIAEGMLEAGDVTLADAARALGALPDGQARQITANYRLLAAPGAENSYIRLVKYSGDVGRQVPTRPGARAWDTGCFWSIMVRAKDMEAIYDDAIALGWWTQTPITDLTFGTSQLKVVVFQGPDGAQVQAYERLAPPLGPEFPAFERLSQPFNLMQMVADREASRRLIEGVFGFSRFWFGPPYLDREPTFMPLGIPRNLTTSVPYKAGIYYPAPVNGAPSEIGRLETIEIEQLGGHDFASRCHAPNFGILAVSYPVDDVTLTRQTIIDRGWSIEIEPRTVTRAPYGPIKAMAVRAPDGGLIEFYSRADASGG